MRDTTAMATETTEHREERLRLCGDGAETIGKRLTAKRLHECGDTCATVNRIPLFEFFGESRYERVVHEFLASMLANSRLKAAGLAAVRRIVKPFDLQLGDGDDLVVDAEVAPIPRLRIDILVNNYSQGWELGIELKVGSGLSPSQCDGYCGWLDNSQNRYLVVVGVPSLPDRVAQRSERVRLWTWLEIGMTLERAIRESASKCSALRGGGNKVNREFLLQFVKGLQTMDGDFVGFENLRLFFSDGSYMALMELAGYGNDVFSLPVMGIDREVIDAAARTAQLAANEAVYIAQGAVEVVRERCKNYVAKKLLDIPRRKVGWYFAFEVLPPKLKKKRRKAATIGVSVCADCEGRPALVLWALWPQIDKFKSLLDKKVPDTGEARRLWGAADGSRILGKILLRTGGGAFKREDRIKREFGQLIDKKLLKGKRKYSILSTLADAAR